jgi:zinc protease
MQKERPVVDGEFQRGESDPGFQIWYESQKRLWGENFSRKITIGDHEVINTATPEKMMVIKDKYYHPNNSILVVSGDVKHDAVFALADKIYGDWANSGFDPHQKYPIPDFAALKKPEYFIKESSIAQTPYLMITWHGPDYRNDSAGTLAADIFSTALGLNSSKWTQALIDKGLATYAGVNYQTNKYVGPIEMTVVPNPAKMKECYNEMMAQMERFAKEDYFTDEQIQTAKDMMFRNDIRESEKPSSLPSRLTYWWASTSLDYFTDYVPNLMKVTRKDLSAYAARYITGKPFVAGMIINADMNKQLAPETFFKSKDF